METETGRKSNGKVDCEKWGGDKTLKHRAEITGLGEMRKRGDERVVREQEKGPRGDWLFFHTNLGIFSSGRIRFETLEMSDNLRTEHLLEPSPSPQAKEQHPAHDLHCAPSPGVQVPVSSSCTVSTGLIRVWASGSHPAPITSETASHPANQSAPGTPSPRSQVPAQCPLAPGKSQVGRCCHLPARPGKHSTPQGLGRGRGGWESRPVGLPGLQQTALELSRNPDGPVCPLGTRQATVQPHFGPRGKSLDSGALIAPVVKRRKCTNTFSQDFKGSWGTRLY